MTTTRLRRLAAPLALALALGTPIGLCSCQARARLGPNPQAASAVERGELVETGTPIYDTFFKTVHELDSLSATGQLEELEAPTALAQALHLLPTSPPELVFQKLRKDVRQMPRLKLELSSQEKTPSAKVVIVEEESESNVEPFRQVLETTVNAWLRIAQTQEDLPERALRMQQMAQTLQGSVPRDFSSSAQRQSVASELKSSVSVLRRIAEESRTRAARERGHVQEIRRILDLRGL